MPIPHMPKKMKELLAAGEAAQRLLNEERFEEAEAIARRVVEDTRRGGWGAAAPCLRLSFICFRQGKLEEAMEWILEAIALEPLDTDYHNGFHSVVQRMREVIEAADLPPTDPRIPRYYAILAREAEATVETHLAMLRHLCAMEETQEAARLSEQVAEIFPSHPEVWRIRAAVRPAGAERPDAKLDGPGAALTALLPRTVGKA